MKKKLVALLSFALAAALICTGFVFAFADQENNMDIPHDHNYRIVGFQNGTATISCEICEDTYSDAFVNHINEQGDCVFDVNDDGYVNMRDYSILVQTQY